MPVFRGIDLAVVASDDAKKLPEYPHPDASSVRLVAVEDLPSSGPLTPKPSEASVLSEGDPTRQKKTHPVVSVYIPSMPGTLCQLRVAHNRTDPGLGEQFWLKYHILRPPPQASHLFFKMFLNGALITSWGMSLTTGEQGQPSRSITGTVVRALYEPGEKWRDERTGAEFAPAGIETRYFHFMPGSDRKSVAEDGGLIEVRIFRSRGRRRRIPKMTEYRDQERYGIACVLPPLPETTADMNFDWKPARRAVDWSRIHKMPHTTTGCWLTRKMRRLRPSTSTIVPCGVSSNSAWFPIPKAGLHSPI